MSPEPPRIPPVASDRQIDLVVRLIDQGARITRPQFFGLDNLPADGRMLLVGNHTIYGALDVPYMVAGIWKERRLPVRSLGEFTHWKIPLWRTLLEQLGAVPGTPALAGELMRRGEPVLVFPGGSREVNKRRGERYQLFWKERTGFARLAIAHDYPVVPFAAVGAEEMLSVVLDQNNALYGAASRLTDRLLGFGLPSIVHGIGPTPLPRPQQLFFWFGEPIPTGRFAGSGDDGARALRDEVRAAVEGGIELLLERRG